MSRTENTPGGKAPTGDEMLRALDALQTQEPSPAIEPPQMIDQAVRNLARRELQAHEPASKSGSLRWIAGLSTVSIALLAIGISMVQTPRVPAPTPSVPLEKAGSQPSAAEAVRSPSTESRTREAARFKREMEHDEEVPAAPELRTGEPAAMAQMNDAAATLEQDAPADAETFTELQPAKAWLDLAEQLYDQGLLAEATEQLQALVEAHPDTDLPPWAVQLLEKEE